MSALQTLLDRLDDPKPSGRDRWRCVCPVCGEGNRSTLSVGVGDTGNVLLKCFKLGCAVEDIAASLGLDVSDLFNDPLAPASSMQRRRLITATQALGMLNEEAQFIGVAAANVANGLVLSESDLSRLLKAAGYIAYLFDEVSA